MAKNNIQFDNSSRCEYNCESCMGGHNKQVKLLNREGRSYLDDHKTSLRFKKGEFIYKEGTYPTGIYCIKKGKVMVTREDENGNIIVVNLQKEVTFLGVPDYFAQLAYQNCCIALEDVEVCVFSKQIIDSILVKNKEFMLSILSTVSQQFFQSNNRMLAMTKKHMTARLATALLELVDAFGVSTDGFVKVQLKRADIAHLSNMTTANVIRNLSEFQKLNILSLEGRGIRIVNKNLLISQSRGL